jgi:hypothetical protein
MKHAQSSRQLTKLRFGNDFERPVGTVQKVRRDLSGLPGRASLEIEVDQDIRYR